MMNPKVLVRLLHYTAILKQAVVICALFWLSFYTVVTLSPLIKVKYANPYEISGRTTHPSAQFNPLTNIARYAFILFSTPLLFYTLNNMKKRGQIKQIQLFLVGVFIISFFLSQTPYYLTKHWNLDMFHDGEQLGSGSSLYFFNKKLYGETFFLHGAVADPLLAYLPFNLWGPSIGSFFLFRSLVNVATFGLFFSLLWFLIRDRLLFIIASIFFFSLGSLYVYTLHRDITVFLYGLLFLLLQRMNSRFSVAYVALSLLSAFTFFLSIDRAMYIAIANFVLGLTYPFFAAPRRSLLKKSFISVGNLLINVVGYGIVFLSAFLLLGSDSFTSFIKMTFVEIPRLLPLQSEYQYPPLTANSFEVYWLPIIITTLLITMTIYIVRYQRRWFHFQFVVPVFFMVLTIVSFKSALGRSSFSHTLYIIQYVFLAVFAFADYMLPRLSRLARRVLYLSVVPLFLWRFSEVERLYTPPKYDASDLRIHLQLPTIDDNYWLTDEVIAVRDYIMKNTTEMDYVFAFVNDAAYYYLTRRPNPTRFSSTWFAEPNFYQREMLTDLQTNPPKYIIYASKAPHNDVDGIPNTARLKGINQWIIENYQEETTITTTVILRKSQL